MTTQLTIDQIAVPPRPADGHKGHFGRVLIIGGSVGMAGAPGLSGLAALRGGAGLVTVAVPEAIQGVVSGFDPSYMTFGLCSDGNRQLAAAAVDDLNAVLDGKNAVAIGPGLGQSDAAADLVRHVLQESPCPVVLDADGLNLAAEHALLRGERPPQPCVVSPHPGEFSRLTGLTVADIERQRTETAVEFAANFGVVVILKGAQTVVTDGAKVFVNSTGNSGMATGGSGDVLTGLLAALLAQGSSVMDSAALGVFIHGLAGDIAAKNVSQRGLIASDLPRFIGEAWRIFEENRSNQ